MLFKPTGPSNQQDVKISDRVSNNGNNNKNNYNYDNVTSKMCTFKP